MTQWAIVAVPKDDDYVWTISSEKVPHMTVLFLGEQGDATPSENLVGFIKHVCDTMMMRFGASVDHRGTLGPDEADVVFFDKFYLDKITKAREALLQNDEIRRLYDSTEQYPEWIPHLTLGYPNKPAKKDTRDNPGITWVEFDRLFLWTGEFDGIMYPLKGWSEVYGNPTMAQTAIAGSEFIKHYGVKGMRWGVRRKRGGGSDGNPSSKSQDHLDARELQKKRASELSNAELKKLNERLQLEQNYAKLLGSKKTTISIGHSYIRQTLDVAKTAQEIYNMANSPAGQALRAQLAKKAATKK